ncbi:hypothetical protein BJ742DRAFT_841203 [Cladochytrium replicatum]|nr:hypothetical protein BJ742DRAFT_841203 [Cladochytrium replicatum]
MFMFLTAIGCFELKALSSNSWGTPKLSPLEFFDREATHHSRKSTSHPGSSSNPPSPDEILLRNQRARSIGASAWLTGPPHQDPHHLSSLHFRTPRRQRVRFDHDRVIEVEALNLSWRNTLGCGTTGQNLQRFDSVLGHRPHLYAKQGWVTHKVVHTEIHVATSLGSVPAWAEVAASSEQLVWIDASEINEIVRTDLHPSNQTSQSPLRPDAIHFAIPLDGDSVRWHLKRSKFYYENFVERSEVTRASVADARWDAGSSSDLFVLWKRDFKDSKLNLLKFRYIRQDGSTKPARAVGRGDALEAYRGDWKRWYVGMRARSGSPLTERISWRREVFRPVSRQ